MSYLSVCVFRHVQYLSDEEQTYDPHWWVTWLYVQTAHTQFVLSLLSPDLFVIVWSSTPVFLHLLPIHSKLCIFKIHLHLN